MGPGFIWHLPSKRRLAQSDLAIVSSHAKASAKRKWEQHGVGKAAEVELFSLEKRKFCGDLIATFQDVKGALEGGLFIRSCIRTRSKGYKSQEEKFRLDIRKKIFTERAVRHWGRWPREVVDAPILAVFKARLDKALSNLV